MISRTATTRLVADVLDPFDRLIPYPQMLTPNSYLGNRTMETT